MQTPINLPLARAAIDRNSEIRSDATQISALVSSPEACALLLSADMVLADSQSAGLRLVRVQGLTDVDLGTPLAFLGKTLSAEAGVAEGSPVFLFDLTDAQRSRLEKTKHAESSDWIHLRRSGQGLSDRDAGLVTQALALANWHRGHEFCSVCGSPSDISAAGWSRTCGKCGKEVFPRNDPAIIVAITDDEDRILLGSQGAWEQNRWSILAGFVDAGETLDDAVKREMFEEAGLVVTELEFLGSQPWPFPYSLMLGFSARARGGQQLRPDGIEIAKLRWFSRDELRVESPHMLLPGKVTISRAMIEHWLGEPLRDSSETPA
ncbi:MAG: NAD(+) diphosphatase [Micrococcales bacterium]